jgi:rhamnose utilization protein RhaD (predicted bifunctional aldolase and dehydrogenase)
MHVKHEEEEKTFSCCSLLQIHHVAPRVQDVVHGLLPASPAAIQDLHDLRTLAVADPSRGDQTLRKLCGETA